MRNIIAISVAYVLPQILSAQIEAQVAPAYHLDASAPHTLTLDDNGAVTAWRDADGRAITFTQPDIRAEELI